MDIIKVIADFVGISPTGLIVVVVAAGVLVVGWAMLRYALKIAIRTFAIGCATIIGLVVGLYVVFVVLHTFQ